MSKGKVHLVIDYRTIGILLLFSVLLSVLSVFPSSAISTESAGDPIEQSGETSGEDRSTTSLPAEEADLTLTVAETASTPVVNNTASTSIECGYNTVDLTIGQQQSMRVRTNLILCGIG